MKLHPIVTELLAEIEAYCARAGVHKTDFGKDAMNDGNFVSRLKSGSSPTLRTVDKVQRYIASRTKAVMKKDQDARA